MEPKEMLLDKLNHMKGGPEECRALYSQWAHSYEEDVLDKMGYVSPRIVAEQVQAFLPKDALILDAGCGTGLLGENLSHFGFNAIEGVDLSEDMLAIADKKNIYQQLKLVDFTQTTDLPDNHYDGVVSSGLFMSGHVGPDALAELTRIAKPGAPIIISVHEQVWKPESYPEFLVSMAIDDLIYINHIKEMPYHQKAGTRGQLCILEKIQA